MKTIKDYPNFQQTEFEKQSVIFSVEEDGYYYLGFYCYSDGKKGWSLTIDNVGVAEVSNNVPGTVGNLTVVPAPLGALKATVAFNAPTADAQGTALDAAVKINVYRDGTLVRTFAEAQPGEALSWLDEGVPESGIHTYRVVASNAAGEGAEAKAEAFVGVDVPGAAGNVTLHDVDGKAVVSWTAPTVAPATDGSTRQRSPTECFAATVRLWQKATPQQRLPMPNCPQAQVSNLFTTSSQPMAAKLKATMP